MKKVDYNQYLKEATEALSKGAFLTVKAGKELNTMTIGWGNIGYIWGKPMMMVMVRESRHTFNLIEKTDEFTVSFSFDDTMKDELSFCGSHSGCNYNKFEKCNLQTISGQEVNTPVIEGCDLHYECKISYKQKMNQNNFDNEFDQKWYKDPDYHTFYYGEIVASYLTE